MSELNLTQTEVVATDATQEITEYDWNTHALYEGKLFNKNEFFDRKLTTLQVLYGTVAEDFPTRAIDGFTIVISQDKWITITKAIRAEIRRLIGIDAEMTDVAEMKEAFEIFQESGGRLVALVGHRYVNSRIKKDENGQPVVDDDGKVVYELQPTRKEWAVSTVFPSLDIAREVGDAEVKEFARIMSTEEINSAKLLDEEEKASIRKAQILEDRKIKQAKKMAELRAKRKQAPSAPSAPSAETETEEVFEESIEPEI